MPSNEVAISFLKKHVELELESLAQIFTLGRRKLPVNCVVALHLPVRPAAIIDGLRRTQPSTRKHTPLLYIIIQCLCVFVLVCYVSIFCFWMDLKRGLVLAACSTPLLVGHPSTIVAAFSVAGGATKSSTFSSARRLQQPHHQHRLILLSASTEPTINR